MDLLGVQVARGAGGLRRRAERRAGLCDIVRDVAASWTAMRGQTLMATLVERLRTHLSARAVNVTEIRGDSTLRPDHPIRRSGYVACAVPGPDASRRLVLEADFDGAGVDDWSCQVLQGAAAVAGFLHEIDRVVGPGRRSAHPSGDGAAPLIGSSLIMQALRERVERVAATDFTVLIEGESGTGKELVARQIHEVSRRRGGPFVALNCAALVETLIEAELFGIEDRTATGVRGRRGKFEHADGGTLFLDEVAELSMAAQAKVLRAIQDLTVERVGGASSRRVDVRIVAATNRGLADLVDQGLFRADLFYRLSGVEVRVPPLRSRRHDILELAAYFLARYGDTAGYQISPAATDALVSYDWPGNVRELERMMEGAIATATSRHIDLDDLPVALRGRYAEVLQPSIQADDTLRAWGSRYVRLMLERTNGNKRKAAAALGISYHTLNAYLRYRPGLPVASARKED
ncbi:MAG: sigma 54-interacting transcriptional regulator [Acidobacteriota bacterium]